MIYGYIYKLFCLDTREMYIGSTINLKQRIDRHNKKNYLCSAKQIIDRNNYIFLILQEGFYVNKDHLRAIEDNYICKLPCINYYRSLSTLEEWNQENLEKIQEYRKQYRSENKEKIKTRDKKYRESNRQKLNERMKEKIPCEFCGILGNRIHKLRHLKTCKKNPNNLISQVSV